MCFSYVDQSLGWMASKAFLDVAYSNDVRAKIRAMAQGLKTSFGQRVDRSAWITNQTKVLIHDKLDKMILKIGYPDEVSHRFAVAAGKMWNVSHWP